MKQLLLIILILVSSKLFAQDTSSIPNITLKTLNGANNSYSNIIKKHRLTVVSFWATWCGPCKLEIEAINDLLPEWQKVIDFDFIAISVDDSRTFQKVKPLVVSSNWNFPVYVDVNQSLQKVYNYAYIPYTIIYDETGNVVYTHTGYKPGEELDLFEIIKKLHK